MTKAEAIKEIKALRREGRKEKTIKQIDQRKVCGYKLADFLCVICKKVKRNPHAVYRTKDSVAIEYSSRAETINIDFKRILNSNKVYVNIKTIRADVVIDKQKFWFILGDDDDIVLDTILAKIESL